MLIFNSRKEFKKIFIFNGTWHLVAAPGLSVVVAHRLICPAGTWDLSSLTRGRTRVSYMGKLIFNHWITREISRRKLLKWFSIVNNFLMMSLFYGNVRQTFYR